MPLEHFEVSTRGKGLYDITRSVQEAVVASRVKEGMAVVTILHTSASLVITENADSTSRSDLEAFFERMVPEGDPHYRHTTEGPDDMPSHIRSALTRSSETLLVESGQLLLGTWQGLYLFEHRRAPHRRRLVVGVFEQQ